jgi:hypothetical protein
MSRIKFLKPKTATSYFEYGPIRASLDFGFALKKTAWSRKKGRNPLTPAFLDVLVDLKEHWFCPFFDFQ